MPLIRLYRTHTVHTCTIIYSCDNDRDIQYITYYFSPGDKGGTIQSIFRHIATSIVYHIPWAIQSIFRHIATP